MGQNKEILEARGVNQQSHCLAFLNFLSFVCARGWRDLCLVGAFVFKGEAGTCPFLPACVSACVFLPFYVVYA